MPVPRKLLKAAFAALSTKSLRAAAEYHDLEDWGERAPASLVGQRRLMAQGIPNPAMHCGEGLKR
jgi:hypothetical protein